MVYRKVWRDLTHNKMRTLLVVLSTAVGVFALGLVFGLSSIMRERMVEDHRATVPAHINLWGGPFNQDVLEAVLRESGVADAELELYTSLHWKLEGEENWRSGRLLARVDYDDQRMNLIGLLDGHWPSRRTLAVERQSAQYFGVPLGTPIVVEFGRYERHLDVEGIVRVPSTFPPQFGGDATFYTTPETAAWLSGDDDFTESYNDLYIRLDSFSHEQAKAVAERVKERLEQMNLSVGGPSIIDPDVHFLQDQVDTMLFILAILGTLSLGLSAFLIINTTNAIIVQQVWQIGVMKTIGATFGRVTHIYLMAASLYGLLALFLAVPLGAIAAYWMAGWLLSLMSIDSGPFRLAPSVVVIQIAIGTSVPLLAALVPVIGGARITPYKAIGNYGLGAGFGTSWLDRLVGRVRRLPRPLMLSLRNTFRRKVRVVLTLLTLLFGGLMFMMVMSVGNSLNNTIEMLLDDLGFDVIVGFDRMYRTSRLTEIPAHVPGATRVEVWDRQGATLALAGGTQRSVSLWGVPSGSKIFAPRIVSGRELLPDDGHAILLNSKIGADEGIRVGDQITMTVGSQESTWSVVGLVLNVNNQQRDNFVPLDALSQETGNVNRGALVMVTSKRQDSGNQQTLMRDLRDAYTDQRVEVAYVQSASEIREQNQMQFNIITYLMLSMATLAAIVGSLSLMGTMSINVVERRREIGMMRAIGATSSNVAGLVVAEGVLLGTLSWLIAAPLSYPGSRLFSRLVGDTLMQLPLDFSYSVGGMALWLLIVVVLSALASLWPALRATRVSVREALAYE